MIRVSIVIITKNEAERIEECLKMSRLITDDIIVVDNGSTDNTLKIAKKNQCRIFHETWNGYGANKNKGIAWAKYDWILSIDADEVPDMELVSSILKLDLNNSKAVYDIKFRSYLGEKKIRFGNWGSDHHIRLFNRKYVTWDESKVHERLMLPEDVVTRKISGYIHHHSAKDIYECNKKAVHYARLSAKQYHELGKKSSVIKRYLSPVLGFIKSFIIRFGFLDGQEGLDIARMIFENTRLKYYYLKKYEQRKTTSGKDRKNSENVVVEY